MEVVHAKARSVRCQEQMLFGPEAACGSIPVDYSLEVVVVGESSHEKPSLARACPAAAMDRFPSKGQRLSVR